MNTLICIILDKSGSMAPEQAGTIGGYNTFLKDQKAITADICRLSLVTFNTEKTVVHSAIPLADVPNLSEHNYVPGGNTALYDAVAEGISIAEKDKQPGERVLVLIVTDGEENSSRETTLDMVQKLITEHEALGDWSFAYIGEKPDQWARETGTSVGNTTKYTGSTQAFTTASNRTTAYRCSTQSSTQNYIIPDTPTWKTTEEHSGGKTSP